MDMEKEVDIKLDKIKDLEVAPKRALPGLIGQCVVLVAALMSLFHVVVLIFWPIDPWYFRSLHITFGALLVFAIVPGRAGHSMDRIPWIDYLLMGSIVLVSGGIFGELLYKLGDLRERDFSRLTVNVRGSVSRGTDPEVSIHA